jgi:putative DNA primase/helicase
VLVIKHRRQFFGPDRDPYLLDSLLEELPGIFAWAWLGLLRLRERGEFAQSQATQEVLAEYKRENNPILSFIQDCTFTELEGGETPQVDKADLYGAYHKYCKENGLKPLSVIHFARQLYQHVPGSCEARRREIEYEGQVQKKKQVRIFKGVALAD